MLLKAMLTLVPPCAEIRNSRCGHHKMLIFHENIPVNPSYTMEPKIILVIS